MRGRRKAIIAAAAALCALAGLTAAALARPRLTPAEIEAACGMARILGRHGESGPALRACADLERRTGGQAFARLALAAIRFESGDLAGAEAEYRRVLADDADSPVALFNLAQCLLREQRPREAAEPLGRFDALYGGALPELGRQARSALGQPAPHGP